MKVVFLLTQDRGGPVDLTVSLAQELAGRPDGPKVTVLGPASIASGGLSPCLLRPVHVRSKLDAKGFGEVSRTLKELDPDVIHAQDRRAGLVSSFAAPSGTPVLLTFHGVSDGAAGRWVKDGPLHGRRPGISGRSRLVADALVGRRVGCTVAPSFAMAEFLTDELRIPENRIRVVHNGVAIPARRKQVDRVRTFTTVGTFAACKATPLLVQTFLTVASHRPGVRLRMIGDGPDRQRCEHIASGGRGGGDVEFTGFTTDVDAQLEQGDAFVLPSLNENLPLALLRAMAIGLPCITADVGGIREALTQDCGILIAPGSSESLLMAMTRLIDQPALAGALGAAGRQRVADRFSLARCADNHLELWSELLWAHRGPRSAVGA